MCNNNDNSGCSCIAEILSVISILQENASCPSDACLDTCDRGFLGCGITTMGCNTRPVQLYTCAGGNTPLAMPTSKEDVAGTTTSSVCRVEKVDGCCATFRVLAPNPNAEEATTSPYVGTNSFFTMNLGCCCSCRCLQDTYVSGV
jgi:hypothetical protein